ncbi:MAG: DUF6515 family protein [Pseudomonadota bacterium]
MPSNPTSAPGRAHRAGRALQRAAVGMACSLLAVAAAAQALSRDDLPNRGRGSLSAPSRHPQANDPRQDPRDDDGPRRVSPPRPRPIGSGPNADVPDVRRPPTAPLRPPAAAPAPPPAPRPAPAPAPGGSWREPGESRTPRWGQPRSEPWRGDPWYPDRYGSHRRPYYGRPVPVLPPHSHTVVHAGRTYWYADGYWYAPGWGGYVLVQPPPGLYVSTLMGPYTVVRVGPHVYYQAYGVYYAPLATGGYQVVAPPQSESPLPPYEPPLAYPKSGQSAQQQSDDEYECHRWAVQETDYDPTLAAVGQENEDTVAARERYTRALTACLEGRGYAVR